MKNGLNKLLTFLQKLEHRHISYTLAHHRDEAVMVIVAIPGERWEVEFFEDGMVEVERFISNGDIAEEEILNQLFNEDATGNGNTVPLIRTYAER
jgi:hypothetical protein